MTVHFTYSEQVDKTSLKQGDILAKTVDIINQKH